MSVESSGLFSLVSLATFHQSAQVINSAFTESKNYIYGLVLNDNKRVHFCFLPKSTDKPKEDPQLEVRDISWFSSESLRPRVVCFNPLSDYGLIATSNLDLLVVSVSNLLPDSVVFGRQQGSGLSWDGEPVTQVFQGPRDNTYGAPTAILWWETSDFVQLGVVATDLGQVVVVNLVTGHVLGTCHIGQEGSKPAVQSLEVMVDSALDCVHMIISAAENQWRLLLEQRSTGYVWAGADQESTNNVPQFLPCLEEGDGTSQRWATRCGAEEGSSGSRGRLSGLKQMSVEKIANIRQRLAEGRRLLRSRSESEELSKSLMTVPECLTSHVGNTRLAVQKDLREDSRDFVAGLFSSGNILTLHNTNLEVLPQSVFKLPPNVDKVLVNGKLLFVTSLPNNSNPPQVSICSSILAESRINDQSFKPQSVLQKFSLAVDETILAVSAVQFPQSSLKISESTSLNNSSQNKSSPQVKKAFRRLVCVTKDQNGDIEKTLVTAPCLPIMANNELDTKECASESESVNPIDRFKTQTESLVEVIKMKHADLCGAYIIVTNKNIILLRCCENPVDLFLGYAMQGLNRESDTIGQAFNLERNHLLELAGDLRLSEHDFTGAVTLYRQAGAKQLKTALKLASTGNVQELLSYLKVVFTSRGLEVGHTERIHLSNLALLCYFQQALASPQAMEIIESSRKDNFLTFLRTNQWFDPGLAVSQALEMGQWSVLLSITVYRGLEHLLGEGVVTFMDKLTGQKSDQLEKVFHGLRKREKQELLSLLLLPNILVSLSTNPVKGYSLAKILQNLLTEMNVNQLNSVLHVSCPGRRDFQPILYTYSSQTDESVVKFARAIIELFCLTCLTLMQHKKGNDKESGCIDHKLIKWVTNYPKRNGCVKSFDDIKEKGHINPVTVIKQRILACGFHHSLHLVHNGQGLLSWGGSGGGNLGHGPSNALSCPPDVVPLFRLILV